jgi:AcrR family transcriptional regulator
MKKSTPIRSKKQVVEAKQPRPMRADGQRKMDSLLKAAAEVFQESGVDAPVRAIADRAGVGIGTVYRHFPQRADLIKGVFQSRVDACADAAIELANRYDPGEALARWVHCYVDFIATKRGLAAALHSGDPAYSTLPQLFNTRLLPALKGLLDHAVAVGAVRAGFDAEELLHAIASLCRVSFEREPVYARKMVSLLVDGLRDGTDSQTTGATHSNVSPEQSVQDDA